MDVSVVVPVFNPGVNLDACLQALLGQTLAAGRYEIVLVDDGSTDGTGALLEQWARREPQRIQVISQPNSGWPGRPRNVGVDHARGDYVQFVDNDDVLAPHALERMLAAAREGDADVVLGKLSSDFRVVNHAVYRCNAQRVTWRDFPLVESLTPHKMFRTALLRDHAIRFAEGPRHLEDQLFCMHAYAHARSVSVVADEPCYFYRRRRGFGRNAGDVPADPDDYYRDLEDVLDVVDRHADDEQLRVTLYERFYRVEMLGRLRDTAMLEYADDYRRRLFHRVHDVATRRVPRALDDRLPFLARVQARFLRAGDLDGMLRFARELATLAVEPVECSPRWVDGRLELAVDALLSWRGEPWLFDDAAALAAGELDLHHSMADVIVVSRADSATWLVPPMLKVQRRDDGVLGVRGTIALDPREAAGGQPLPSGLWDPRLRVVIGGMTRTALFACADDDMWCLYGDSRSVSTYRTAAGNLALDVDEWMHSLTDHVASAATPTGAGRWRVDRLVAPTSVRRQCDLLAVGNRTSRLRAALDVRPDGATLHTTRRAAPTDVWVRAGAAGRSAPARLSR